jgi:hypothetical protein
MRFESTISLSGPLADCGINFTKKKMIKERRRRGKEKIREVVVGESQLSESRKP